jgi:hypothetical protein
MGPRPYAADSSTVRFVKEHRIPGRRLYWLTLSDTQRRRWRLLAERVEHGTDGWVVSGEAGGTGEGLERTEPWLNLAGGWSAHGFYAGGELAAAGAEVARVRLRSANGLVLEDDAEHGVVLFATGHQVEAPLNVEIVDGAGAVVARHTAF